MAAWTLNTSLSTQGESAFTAERSLGGCLSPVAAPRGESFSAAEASAHLRWSGRSAQPRFCALSPPVHHMGWIYFKSVFSPGTFHL